MRLVKGRMKSNTATHLVVGQESGFVGEVTSHTATGCRRADVEFLLVDQREGSAVRGYSDHELLFRCSLLHPLARAVILRKRSAGAL